MALDGDDLAHIVWQGAQLIYVHQNPDDTWTPPRIVLEESGGGPGPEIAIDASGTVHLVWDGPDQDIYYAKVGSD